MHRTSGLNKIIKTFLFFYFLSFLSLLSGAAGAVENDNGDPQGVIGVKIDIIYSMHPLMQYYDPQLHLFIKPVDAQTSEEFSKQLNKRKILFEESKKIALPQVDKLKNKITSLSSELKKLENEKSEEIYKLSESVNRAISSKNKTAGEKFSMDKIHEARKKYDEKISEIRRQIDDAVTLTYKTQLDSLKTHYLSPEESAALMDKIDSEIISAVTAVAAIKKASIAANITAAELSGVLTENSAAKAVQTSEKTAGEKNAAALIKTQAAAYKPFAVRVLSDSAPDYSKAMFFFGSDAYFEDEEKNKSHLKEVINSIDLMSAAPRLTSVIEKPDFVKELNPEYFKGEDLTAAVIIYILKNYGFDKRQAEDFFNAVSELDNK
ncbi:MAG: hypothetical protein BWY32_00950 [bacterium ADurb.Bin243]|mgnify:CR=1 FL=1|nr:MAG: hypothetical protein BWY32_00950 [bacterium ADurb.Bin243]